MTRQALLPPLIGRLLALCALLAGFACAPVRAEEPPLQLVVDKLATRAVFRIGPDEAAAYFADLAPMTSKGPGKHLWVHENNAPGKGLAWVRAEYQPGVKARWVLLQTSVVLPLASATQPDLYATLKEQLRKKLGKPELSREKPDEKMTVWPMGGSRTLILRRGDSTHARLKTSRPLVHLEASNAQGDEDERPPR